MLTIWERLLGHPLISSIFSFAAVSGKRQKYRSINLQKETSWQISLVRYVLFESEPDRFLTSNVETRSCLSNCVAGPAGMRLLWGFPQGDWLLSTLHPGGPSHTPTPPRQLKQGRSLTADNCTHGYNDSYVPAGITLPPALWEKCVGNV